MNAGRTVFSQLIAYRQRTIAAAVQQTREVYDPNTAQHTDGRGNGFGRNRPRKQPEVDVRDLLHGYNPQEVENGQSFRAMYGEIVRWWPEMKKYLVWNARRWNRTMTTAFGYGLSTGDD